MTQWSAGYHVTLLYGRSMDTLELGVTENSGGDFSWGRYTFYIGKQDLFKAHIQEEELLTLAVWQLRQCKG